MHILVTGGAGFIGCNLVARLLRRGDHVTIFDNLSRPRTPHNLAWLEQIAAATPGRLEMVRADIRDADALVQAAKDVAAIFHLAGQVAVTTSVLDPRSDFEINALGTFNVLEAARTAPKPPAVIYASTNKVYGGMEDLTIVEDATRYRYRDLPYGIDEARPLDFHSPYGNSKGSGDQYVRDYARIYGIPTVVLRQSAIYGPRQFGVEDQGWAAHFVIAAQTGKPISIYGDGKQVRDMLFIDDLIDLYEVVLANVERLSGQIFNVGGGPQHSISIWREFQPLLTRFAEDVVEAAHYGDWRPGDQPVCILDIRKAERELGWKPQVDVETGLRRLWDWVAANIELFR
ncbi:MAG: NAD-dependent epimerase/dehydratase family protein [Oscillochloris sp.]|nr:NAD-dependent epimerase/dehydratase family protein [Oscillochloris sp.]